MKGLAARGLAVAVGSALILLGAGADLLHGGGSRGLGPAQLSLIVLGAAVALAAWLMPWHRSRLGRKGISSSSGRALDEPERSKARPLVAVGLAGTSFVATLLLLEGALALAGTERWYGNQGIVGDLVLAPWWSCDQPGRACRFDPAASALAAEHQSVSTPRRESGEDRRAELFLERLAIINRQGFHDAEDFTAVAPAHQGARILVLGDSHAFGFYAPLGDSWVETMSQDLEHAGPATTWNTGIPGAATVHEAQAAQQFLPLLQPDLVILAFYPANDLDGNLGPADSFYASSEGFLFGRYKTGPDFAPLLMSPSEAYHRATGTRARNHASRYELALGHTRIGALALRTWGNLRPDLEWLWSRDARLAPSSELKRAEAEERTRRLLIEIRQAADDHQARLLVLLVPSPRDLETPSPRFLAGQRLLAELGLETLDPTSLLTPSDYWPQDEHWNEAGHRKVGHWLADRCRKLLGQEVGQPELPLIARPAVAAER